MPRLFIANDFLADFSKLEKSVQNSVRATIGKFNEHTHAGVHLEKLHQSRDDRLRTIRVDKFWRGVVLAPESGDTYCLITVLPHDKAMAYVASRRYSVNEALGVLEVRNESALEQARPGLQTIAETAEQFLFDHVSEAGLKRLGVDAQILPIVRLLTSEEHLDALQTMLPEPQYAALYALACGMTPEEAWTEVAQLLTAEAPPRDVDPGDLVAAMERTPGQVAFVSGPDELQAILAHPFAAWRVFLHPSQRRIAREKTYSGPAQVTGGAGTGKTITALHRTAYLAARLGPPDGEATPPILLTSYTRNLVHALEAQLPLIASDPELRDRIEILTVDQLASRVVRQAQGRHPAAVGDYELRQLLAAAARSAHLPFTGTFLQREWEQVILAQDLQTEWAYLECRRAGRGTPLSRDQRRQVWRAVEQATAELRAAGKSSFTQLASQAAHLLRDSGRPPYRHVLVDESQDLHPAQWRLLRAAVAPGPDDLFIAGDPYQRIYGNRVSLTSLGISIRGRSRRLTLNYRTTQEILAWSVPLLGSSPVTGLDGDVGSLAGYRSPVHGPQPALQGASDGDEELKNLTQRIRSWLAMGIEAHAIGVAARSNRQVRAASEALEAAGIPTAKPDVRDTADRVRAGTMHSMKGLEFQAVAVIAVDEGVIPSPAAVTTAATDPVAHDQDLLRERCLLFVACTRARDHLYVSYSGQPSPFLPRRYFE